jgi:hypothetical protein
MTNMTKEGRVWNSIVQLFCNSPVLAPVCHETKEECQTGLQLQSVVYWGTYWQKLSPGSQQDWLNPCNSGEKEEHIHGLRQQLSSL